MRTPNSATNSGLPKKSSEKKMINYYAVLGVVPEVTPKTLKRAYKKLAIRNHPDRRKRRRRKLEMDNIEDTKNYENLGDVNNTPSRRAPKSPKSPGSVPFAVVTRAWRILSDPVSRCTYDMLQGYKSSKRTEEAFVNLMRMKKAQAAAVVENMEFSVAQSRKHEQNRNGLVIISGVYGHLNGSIDTLSTLDDQASEFGLTIDVTVPLQCSVEKSTLRLTGGKPKFWLPGFYDPCPSEDKQLCVRYLFKGRLHEVTVDDLSEMRLPMKRHLLGDAIQFGKHDGKTAKSKRRRRRRSSIGGKFVQGSLHYTQLLEERRSEQRRNALVTACVVSSIILWTQRNAVIDWYKSHGKDAVYSVWANITSMGIFHNIAKYANPRCVGTFLHARLSRFSKKMQ